MHSQPWWMPVDNWIDLKTFHYFNMLTFILFLIIILMAEGLNKQKKRLSDLEAVLNNPKKAEERYYKKQWTIERIIGIVPLQTSFLEYMTLLPDRLKIYGVAKAKRDKERIEREEKILREELEQQRMEQERKKK